MNQLPFIQLTQFIHLTTHNEPRTTKYAKQSQFRESSNERKYLLYKGLSKFYPAGGAKKQTQFKPNQTQVAGYQNERKLNFNKGLQKKR